MKTLIAALLFAATLQGTITETSFATCNNASGCNSAAGATISVTVTVHSGNAAIVLLHGNSTFAGGTGGQSTGTWSQPSCGGTNPISTVNPITLVVNLNTTSNTAVYFTLGTSGQGRGITYFEVSHTLANIALDYCNLIQTTNASTSLTGVGLTLTAGANEALFQGASINGGVSVTAISGAYSGNISTGTRAAAWAVSSTGTAPTWTLSVATSETDNLAGAALKEYSSATHIRHRVIDGMAWIWQAFTDLFA